MSIASSFLLFIVFLKKEKKKTSFSQRDNERWLFFLSFCRTKELPYKLKLFLDKFAARSMVALRNHCLVVRLQGAVRRERVGAVKKVI